LFSFRATSGPVEVAFTDRAGGVSAPPFDSLNLAAVSDDDPASVTENLCRVQQEFAGNAPVALLHQVHGREVLRVGAGDGTERPTAGVDGLPEADGLVTDEPGVVLAVRVADCVPLLLGDPEVGTVAALHVGRPGLAAGVVQAGLEALAGLGAEPARLRAWLGPHVCGRCYEVPADMRDEVETRVPGSGGTTSWGTPSVDLGAGIRSLLAAAGVPAGQVTSLDRCTREDPELFSYRRDGRASGRLAGLVRLVA
jgi:YfiH family protein